MRGTLHQRNRLLEALGAYHSRQAVVRPSLMAQPGVPEDPVLLDALTDSDDNELYSGKISLADATMKMVPNPSFEGTWQITQQKLNRLQDEARDNLEKEKDLLSEENSTLFATYTNKQPLSSPSNLRPEQLQSMSKKLLGPGFGYFIPGLPYDRDQLPPNGQLPNETVLAATSSATNSTTNSTSGSTANSTAVSTSKDQL